MSDYVPEDLVRQILIRLPVRDLLRFRSVSKPWGTVIDSKGFTKAHLDHAVRTRSNRSLLVNQHCNRPGFPPSYKFICVDLDSVEKEFLRSEDVSCGGSCNGLCLLRPRLGWFVILCNPATQKFLDVPTEEDPFKQFPLQAPMKVTHLRFALGYDSKEDDYKIVSVVQVSEFMSGGAFASKATIYSLKSNMWKPISEFPYMLHPAKVWGNCTNDALHIVVKDDNEPDEPARIMAFHVGTEVHYEVTKPEQAGSLQHVAVMNGCLTAVFTGSNTTEIWIMKEYRVEESWCKLMRFQPQLPKLIPLAYSKSGDEVLINYGGLRLNWYSLGTLQLTRTRTAHIVGLSDAEIAPPGIDAFACVASLVSPFSPPAPLVVTEKPKVARKKRDDDDFLASGFKLKL